VPVSRHPTNERDFPASTVEPVFGNIRYNKGLDRFTLRGQTKVDTQWKLFCLVHNIEKLAHHGYAVPSGYGQ
jgi:hypothetical protein